MHTSQPSKMLVMDYSGTLSLQSTFFGCKENLIRELQYSGLSKMGVDSADKYWSEIVFPTWKEGSTTSVGLKRLIFDRVNLLTKHRSPEDELWACASRFVDRYLSASIIDPAWKNFLQTTLDQSDTLMVVATDHYAEATAHIISQLNTLDIEGVTTFQSSWEHQVLVANSADMGHVKASPGFWEALKKALDLGPFSKILILDDFGYNEQASDEYASPDKITQRIQQTVEGISTVFNAHASAFPFFVQRTTNDSLKASAKNSIENSFRVLIKQAEDYTQTFFL
jgi:hypothetical protein